MWTKISSVLKRGEVEPSNAGPREVAELGNHDERPDAPSEPGPSTVMSPPSSPTRQNKRGLFKRASKIYSDNDANGSTLSLARRVKSSLHLNSNMNVSNMSLASQSGQDVASQPVLGSVRSLFNKDRKPTAMQLHASFNKSDDALSKHSVETTRPMSPVLATASIPAPHTPLEAQYQYGSVRSILRDKNTPGSGQNVRFFSRDAYRVISPESSLNNSSGEPLEPPTMQSLTAEMSPECNASPSNGEVTKYHSASASPNGQSPTPASSGIFMLDGSPAATSTPYGTQSTTQRGPSTIMPLPPPQLSGLFDSSRAAEHGVHSIPEGDEDNDIDGVGTSPKRSLPRLNTTSENETANRESSHSSLSSASLDTPNSVVHEEVDADPQQKSEQPVFRSREDSENPISRSSSSHVLRRKVKRESAPVAGSQSGSDISAPSIRSRSFSDKVFSRPQTEDMKASPLMPPFMAAFGNFSAPNDIGLRTPAGVEPPDPFRADASNYYNADAGFPTSPPRLANVRYDSGVSSTSSCSASGASHHSSTQSPRAGPGEEMVMALRTQLAFHQELSSQYELDISARDEHVRLLNDKVRGYEEEAEKRTKIMRGMRRKVQEMERAYRSLELQVDESRQESFERSVMSEASGEALKALQRKIDDLQKEKIVLESENEKLKDESQKQNSSIDMKIIGEAVMPMQNSSPEQAWEEERAGLIKQLEQMNTFGEQLLAKDNEIDVLKQEVEAQWANTESFNDKFDALRKEKQSVEREKEQLQNDVAGLEARINDIEVDWTESENQKINLEAEFAEVCAAKEEAERERDQLKAELVTGGPQLEDTRQAMQTLESQIKTLTGELEFANERVAHLEETVANRDAELTTYSQKLIVKEHEIDELRDQSSSLRREYSRLQTETDRARDEIDAREADIQRQLVEAMRARAEAQLEATSLRERVPKLEAEVENLRRQVHETRQRSADLDVKILQMERQHEQDTEDKIGLNIALDSKQQELELLKRKMGVRGTAGATPAVSARPNRRDSMAFKTPVPMRPSSALSNMGRPPSALSDVSSKAGNFANETPVPRTVLGSRTNILPAASTLRKARHSDASIDAPTVRRPRPSAPSPLTSSTTRPVHARTSSLSARPTTAKPRPMSTVSLASKASFLQSSTASEASSVAADDKENATPRPKSVTRRMSMQPIAA